MGRASVGVSKPTTPTDTVIGQVPQTESRDGLSPDIVPRDGQGSHTDPTPRTSVRIRDLDEALEAIFAFTGPRAEGRSSVRMMETALDLLGNPHRGLRVIHVTGTSGKTSTCYYTRSLLEAAGRTTGLTVSPHVVSLNERVQVGGRPLPEPEFCEALESMLSALEQLRGHLTYFEVVVCLAWWVFAQRRVDYAIVEVGIGGTRDATNVARGSDKIAVIGPIGLDHTEKLGSTIAQIAEHKAGIISCGGVVFVAEQTDEALGVIQERAASIGAKVVPVGAGVPDGSSVRREPETAFQRSNWKMALAVAAFLAKRDGFELPDEKQTLALIRAGGADPPARFEWFRVGERRVLLDGAHNPQKIAGLVSALRERGVGPMPALATLSQAPADKVRASLEALRPAVTRLIIPEFLLGRGDKTKASIPSEEVAQVARCLGIHAVIIPDLADALARLLAEDAPRVLVTGSLYLASLVRPLLVGTSEPPPQ